MVRDSLYYHFWQAIQRGWNYCELLAAFAPFEHPMEV